MSYNYARTIRNSSTYSQSKPASTTSQSSDAWNEASDVVDTYEDQEANFWSDTDTDTDTDDVGDCVFFSVN